MATLKDLPVELMLRIVHYVSETMHEDTDTAKFLESPIVAPREVDRAFWRLTLARYQDLRHLALTSRVMRPLAQEYLFRAVAVDNSVRTERGAITGIHRLLIVLSQRPDLAKRAQSLHIDINPYVVHHAKDASRSNSGCEKNPCHCRFYELQEICATLVEGIEMSLWLTKAVPSSFSSRRRRYDFYAEWQKILRNEYDHHFIHAYVWAGITGIIPYLLPNLSALSLNTHRDDEAAFHFSFRLPAIVRPALITGFSKMTMLKTTFVPPWAAVTIPTLRSLHIDLSDGRYWYDGDEFGPEQYEIADGDTCTIKHVILDLSVLVLECWEGDFWGFRIDNTHYETAKKLLRNLIGLFDLQIRLSYQREPVDYQYEDMYWERLETGYGELTGFLENPTVESVTVDAADVDWSLYKKLILNTTYSHIWRFQAESMSGFHSNLSGPNAYGVLGLSNVCRLVLPQEALISSHLNPSLQWQPTPLPKTVQEVGIVDSTQLLDHWARHVLEYPSQYPNLERVVLWCDRLSVPLAPDARLRQFHESVDSSAVQQTNSYLLDDDHLDYLSEGYNREMVETVPEELKLEDKDDGVWDELQRAGIDIVINFKQDQGWRHPI